MNNPSGSDLPELGALEVAERLFSCIEAGDMVGAEAMMADDMSVWTNFDGRTVDRDRALRTIGWLTTTLAGLTYDIEERIVTADGFVQRHVLRATVPSGTEIAMPACIVASVADGRVTAMFEYADPTNLMAALT